MLGETDVRVVIHGGGRRQQDHPGMTARCLGSADQFLADPEFLVRVPDRQIREIGGVGEVGNRS